MRTQRSALLVFATCLVAVGLTAATDCHVLTPSSFAHHVERFNAMEDENVTNFISNGKSWEWLQQNIPLFECAAMSLISICQCRRV